MFYLDAGEFPDDFVDEEIVQVTGIETLAPNAVAIVLLIDINDDQDEEFEIERAVVDFNAAWPDLPEGTVVGLAPRAQPLGPRADRVQIWVRDEPPMAPNDFNPNIFVSYAFEDEEVVDAASYLPLEDVFSVLGVRGATESATFGGENDDPPVGITPNIVPAVASPGLVLGINLEEDSDCSLIELVCVFLDAINGLVAGIAGILPF